MGLRESAALVAFWYPLLGRVMPAQPLRMRLVHAGSLGGVLDLHVVDGMTLGLERVLHHSAIQYRSTAR